MSDIRTWTPESDILKPGEPCSVQEIRSWFERLPRMRALIRQQQEHIESLRPVAHWDMEEDAVGDPIIWTCSNCKESIVMYDGTPMENGYKYCPMCGARIEDATND